MARPKKSAEQESIVTEATGLPGERSDIKSGEEIHMDSKEAVVVGKMHCPFCMRDNDLKTVINDEFSICPTCGSILNGVCRHCGSKKSPRLSAYCVSCGCPFDRAGLKKFLKDNA